MTGSSFLRGGGEGSAEQVEWIRSWESAPCALLDVDPDGMIVAANRAFCEVAGFTVSELVGRVRWLDLLSVGSRLFYETRLAAVLLLEGSITEVMIEVVPRNGGTVPALVNGQLLRAHAGSILGTRLAVMTARDRQQFEAVLRGARDAAEQAESASARTRRRLELQAEATGALAGGADPGTAIDRLARVLVPRLADWCLIFTSDPSDPVATMRWAAAHIELDKQQAVERVAELTPHYSSASTFFAQSLAGRAATLIPHISEKHLDSATADPELRSLLSAIGSDSAIVAPSYARGERVAVTVLVRGSERIAFTEDERADMAEVAARTAIIIDNTHRYAREHADSITLQNSLLTAPPSIPDLELEVRYVPSQVRAQVGGDWYDAYVQPDGATVVVIGDVVGHDIVAAAAMGRLRGVIRTIGHTIFGSPCDTLARADRAARDLQADVIASAILARIEKAAAPAEGPPAETVTLRWTNAGHPPPMLLSQTGEVTILERPADLLLGVSPNQERHDHTVELHPGDTLLLYTDGLIEHPLENIDDSLTRLSAALTNQHLTTLGSLCDLLLRELASSSLDDIALLALRLR